MFTLYLDPFIIEEAILFLEREFVSLGCLASTSSIESFLLEKRIFFSATMSDQDIEY